jgi:hypothetical protein
MERPTIKTVWKDARSGGKYIFLAYRILTRQEVEAHMANYLSGKNPRATKKHSIIIETLID